MNVKKKDLSYGQLQNKMITYLKENYPTECGGGASPMQVAFLEDAILLIQDKNIRQLEPVTPEAIVVSVADYASAYDIGSPVVK